MLVSIAYRYLRDPLRHLRDCADKCAPGCLVQEFHVALNEPVLASEMAKAKADEDRMQALARGDFTHLEGAGDEGGQPPD